MISPLKFLEKPITSFEDAKIFIDNLQNNDVLFHFDDDPYDIIAVDGERTFSDEEAKLIDLRVPELFAQEWGEFECPHGYALHLMRDDDNQEATK